MWPPWTWIKECPILLTSISRTNTQSSRHSYNTLLTSCHLWVETLWGSFYVLTLFTLSGHLTENTYHVSYQEKKVIFLFNVLIQYNLKKGTKVRSESIFNQGRGGEKRGGEGKGEEGERGEEKNVTMLQGLQQNYLSVCDLKGYLLLVNLTIQLFLSRRNSKMILGLTLMFSEKKYLNI